MAKYVGHDTDLAWDKAGATAWVTIGQIIDISGPSLERNSIDVTTRDSTSNWREFLKGFKDAGELSFNVVLDTQLANQGTGATGILGDFLTDTATIPAWQVTFPDATVWTMDGFLTGAELGHPLDDALTADITVKVTGVPAMA